MFNDDVSRLDLADINKRLDELKDHTDAEIDNAVLEDNLDEKKIIRISATRSTIVRIKSIFNK